MARPKAKPGKAPKLPKKPKNAGIKAAVKAARAQLDKAHENDLTLLQKALDAPEADINRELLAQNIVANLDPIQALKDAGFEPGPTLRKSIATLKSVITTHPLVGKRVADLLLQRSTMMLRESARQMVETGLTAEMVLGGLMRIAAVCMDPATYRPNIARQALRDLGDHLGLFRDHTSLPPIDPKLMDFVMRLNKLPEEQLDQLIGMLMAGDAVDVTPKPGSAPIPVSASSMNGNGHHPPAAGDPFAHLPLHARPPSA